MISILMDKDKDKPLDVDSIYEDLKDCMVEVLIEATGQTEKELRNNDALNLMD